MPHTSDRQIRPSPASRFGGAGLCFGVAETIGDVLTAWRLAYESDVRDEHILPNETGLHTFREAISPDTVVITSRIREVMCSTLTVIPDLSGSHALPLERIFSTEHRALYTDGCVPAEIVLHADRRRQITRSMDSFLHMVHHAVSNCLWIGVTDLWLVTSSVQAPLYTSTLGFTQVEIGCPDSLHGEPSDVLLQCSLRADRDLSDCKALRYFRSEPVSETVFHNRFVLSSEAVSETPIATFLNNSGHH